MHVQTSSFISHSDSEALKSCSSFVQVQALFLCFPYFSCTCYSATAPAPGSPRATVKWATQWANLDGPGTKRSALLWWNHGMIWKVLQSEQRLKKMNKSQLRLTIQSNSIHIRTSDYCGLPWQPFPYLFPYLSFFCLIFFHFFWPCGQVFDPEGLPGCHLRRVWFGILSRLLSKCLNENHEEPVEPKQMKLCQAWWTLMNAEILMNMEAKEI